MRNKNNNSMPGTATPADAQGHVPTHEVARAWSASIVVGVMTAALASVATSPFAPGWLAVIVALMLLLTAALLHDAWRTSRRAWAYRGASASFLPREPLAGTGFDAAWRLPPHIATPAQVRLRVAQYRIDDSSSSRSERLAEVIPAQNQRLVQTPDGSRLQARFELPADAPSHGARRSGEEVVWRFEWLDARDRVVMTVPLPVRADARLSEPAVDRLSREAQAALRDLPATAASDAMPALPPGVSLREPPDALVLNFESVRLRRFGALMALAWAIAFAWPYTRHAWGLWLELPLLAIALQVLSRRWTLQVRDDGLVLDRTSWLWRQRTGLPASCLQALGQRWRYSRGGGQHLVECHALVARDERGQDWALTPALAADGAARVAQMLRWAHAQRAGRFSPGEQRAGHTPLSRPGWGWLLCLAWLAARLWAGG